MLLWLHAIVTGQSSQPKKPEQGRRAEFHTELRRRRHQDKTRKRKKRQYQMHLREGYHYRIQVIQR